MLSHHPPLLRQPKARDTVPGYKIIWYIEGGWSGVVPLPLHGPWSMGMSPHHFNHPLCTILLHTQAQWPLLGWMGKPRYIDSCLVRWTVLKVMWAHPLLLRVAHSWYRSIVDINPPWHGHWVWQQHHTTPTTLDISHFCIRRLSDPCLGGWTIWRVMWLNNHTW